MALRKIIFVFALSALFLSALAGGLLLFYLTHPAALKPVLERQLSRIIEVGLRMESLDYTLSPLSIEIRGLKTGMQSPSESGVSASVSVLTFDMQRRGDFGDKTLVLHPEITGFSLTIGPDYDPSGLWAKEKGSSFWGKRLADLVGLFLFQEIRLGSLRLDQGQAQADLQTEETRFSSRWLVLEPFAASLSVSGQYPLFELQKGRAEIPKATLDISGRRIEFEPLGLQLSTARIDVHKRSLQMPELRIRSRLFETLFLSLNHDPQKTSLDLQG